MLCHHVFTLCIAASCTHILPRFDLVKKSFEKRIAKKLQRKESSKSLEQLAMSLK